MLRVNAIEFIKNQSYYLYGDENLISLSKTIGFLYLKAKCESFFAEITVDDNEILESCVDGKNDKELDYIFTLKKSEQKELHVHLIQCKYSENETTTISSSDIRLFTNSVDDFPQVANANPKIIQIQDEINDELSKGFTLVKHAHYINLGGCTTEATNDFNSSLKSIFTYYIDYECFAKVVFEDLSLPDLLIHVDKNLIIGFPNSGDSGYISIISLERFIIDNKSVIEDHTAFLKNVRHQVTSKVSKEVKKSIDRSPAQFLSLNNGITIVCRELIDESDDHDSKKIIIKQASIVNGQQTILSVFEKQKKVGISNDAYILCKIIQTSKEDYASELAKSSNSQTNIKPRSLYSNETYMTVRKTEALSLTPEDYQFYFQTKTGTDLNLNKIQGERKKIRPKKEKLTIIGFEHAVVLLNILETGIPLEIDGLEDEIEKYLDDTVNYPTYRISLMEKLFSLITSHTEARFTSVAAKDKMKDTLKIFEAKKTINLYIMCIMQRILKEVNISLRDSLSAIHSKARNSPRVGNYLNDYTGMPEIIKSSILLFTMMVDEWNNSSSNLTRDKIRKKFDETAFEKVYNLEKGRNFSYYDNINPSVMFHGILNSEPHNIMLFDKVVPIP